MTSSLAWGLAAVLCFSTAGPATAAAPIDYEFRGYAHPKWWRSIYLGRFDLLRPGGCGLRGQGIAFCDSGKDRVWDSEDFAAIQMLTDLIVLSGAFVGYHRAWARQCKLTSSEATSPVTYEVVTTTTQGFSSTTSTSPPVTVQVRDRFVPAYRDDHLLFRAFDREAAMDLDRLLVEQQCGSELLTQFEDNLHRAIMRGTSVQASRAGLDKTPLFSKGCQQVLPEVKGSRASEAACPCLYRQFSSTLRPEHLFHLEDNFTKENFLWMSVSAVGLKDKIAVCLR